MEINPIRLKNVVLVESGLFSGGILQDLIAQKTRLVVISLAGKDIDGILKEISYQDPDVLVVEDRTFQLYGRQFLTLLQECVHYKIVVLNSKDNQGEVYAKQAFQIRQAADFFDVL
ncbi:MAG TPA: hypothetical protein VGJ97_02200 [Anaerolineaceae bacterium]|jgi:hypothetical protein